MGFPHLASRAPEIGNHQSTRNHVQGVQPCEGEVDRKVSVGPRPPGGSLVNLLLGDFAVLGMMMVATSFMSMRFGFLDGGGTVPDAFFCRIGHRMAQHDELIGLFHQVAIHTHTIVEDHIVMRELRVVFERLDDHEKQSTQNGDSLIQFELLEVVELQARPGHDHGHTGKNQHQGVDETWAHIQETGWPMAFHRTYPQENVGGKEGAKEHDLRGQEQPDANLGVV